jgi:hypothetical protein
MRNLCVLAPLGTAVRLTGPIGRGEVWTCGAGTAVVMTPDPPHRTPATAAVLSVGLHCLLVLAIPALLTAATLGLGGAGALIGPVAAIGWLTGLLLPVLAPIWRSARGVQVRLIREGSSGRTVRLHDLARHPDDPPGTGTRLLAAMLSSPIYRDDTVTATAVSARLADLYTAAGMTPLPSGPTGGGAS